jgi:hypothetical protein
LLFPQVPGQVLRASAAPGGSGRLVQARRPVRSSRVLVLCIGRVFVGPLLISTVRLCALLQGEPAGTWARYRIGQEFTAVLEPVRTTLSDGQRLSTFLRQRLSSSAATSSRPAISGPLEASDVPHRRAR